MRSFIFSFFILIIFTGNSLFSQKLSFYKEDLKFQLDTNSFTVDGLYYFSNSDSVKISQFIFYPFPVDETFGTIDTALVYDSTLKKKIEFSRIKDNKGISFPLSIEGYGFRKIRIYYRQELKENKAEYILKTTQNWGKPLETADYTLTIPDKIKIDSISYPADKIIQINASLIYYWSKKNFLPQKDFLIYFKY